MIDYSKIKIILLYLGYLNHFHLLIYEYSLFIKRILSSQSFTAAKDFDDGLLDCIDSLNSSINISLDHQVVN